MSNSYLKDELVQYPAILDAIKRHSYWYRLEVFSLYDALSFMLLPGTFYFLREHSIWIILAAFVIASVVLAMATYTQDSKSQKSLEIHPSKIRYHRCSRYSFDERCFEFMQLIRGRFEHPEGNRLHTLRCTYNFYAYWILMAVEIALVLWITDWMNITVLLGTIGLALAVMAAGFEFFRRRWLSMIQEESKGLSLYYSPHAVCFSKKLHWQWVDFYGSALCSLPPTYLYHVSRYVVHDRWDDFKIVLMQAAHKTDVVFSKMPYVQEVLESAEFQTISMKCHNRRDAWEAYLAFKSMPAVVEMTESFSNFS